MNSEMLYTDIDFLIKYVEGSLSEEMNAQVQGLIHDDAILQEIVEGIKLDLSQNNEVPIREFLDKSKERFEKEFYVVENQIRNYSLQSQRIILPMMLVLLFLLISSNNVTKYEYFESDQYKAVIDDGENFASMDIDVFSSQKFHSCYNLSSNSFLSPPISNSNGSKNEDQRIANTTARVAKTEFKNLKEGKRDRVIATDSIVNSTTSESDFTLGSPKAQTKKKINVTNYPIAEINKIQLEEYFNFEGEIASDADISAITTRDTILLRPLELVQLKTNKIQVANAITNIEMPIEFPNDSDAENLNNINDEKSEFSDGRKEKVNLVLEISESEINVFPNVFLLPIDKNLTIEFPNLDNLLNGDNEVDVVITFPSGKTIVWESNEIFIYDNSIVLDMSYYNHQIPSSFASISIYFPSSNKFVTKKIVFQY